MNWTDFFMYEPETGRLLWKVKRPGPKTFIGMVAGSVKTDGRYRSVCLNGKRNYVHRIVWEMHFGQIPSGMCIDHIDGNGLNNKLQNLRVATLSENQRNRSQSKVSKTGIQGVFHHRGGFSVSCAGKYVTYKKDFFEACCARKSAERVYGYHENNGRKAP